MTQSTDYSKERQVSDTFCDRLYTELHIEEDGSVTPCCVMPSNRFPMGDSVEEYLSGQPLKDVKKALFHGEQHPNCEWCWKNEQNGLKTHRITKPRGKGLQSIHIRLNNVCNFSCRMCGPAFSSTWMAENKKHNWFEFEDANVIVKDAIEKNGDYLFNLLKKNIRFGKLSKISISGGEPLITKAHYKLLSFLIDNDLTNISLSYSTNLSKLDYNNIDLLPLWEKFDSVDLEVSLDGWGDAVEYSRTGFNTKIFLENFKKAKKYINTINCVVNVYSVWSLKFIEKFRELGMNIVYSPCYLPLHTNPQLLLGEDKQRLKDIYQGYPVLLELLENFIDKDMDFGYTLSNKENSIQSKTHSLDIQEMRHRMIEYNLLLDSYRNTNFFDVFPIYKKYQQESFKSNWIPWYTFNESE